MILGQKFRRLVLQIAANAAKVLSPQLGPSDLAWADIMTSSLVVLEDWDDIESDVMLDTRVL